MHSSYIHFLSRNFLTAFTDEVNSTAIIVVLASYSWSHPSQPVRRHYAFALSENTQHHRLMY